MIYKIRGQLIKKEDNRAIIDVSGIFYEINIPKTVFNRLKPDENNFVELITYQYLTIDGNRGIPAMVGFIDELEKDFFEKFISVSGVGPKAALRALDQPISTIAQAIEKGDLTFLVGLVGIGNQRAKQIVAHLQGKVGRFALIRDEGQASGPEKNEVVEEAKQILRRLQYSNKEVEAMIKKAIEAKPSIDSSEELLNEIYRQKK
ncbi:MAG: hypothetical protein K9L86_01960 [Candidatus Omnitrophica bacterium]|nr:hypothetical protein [Candidatus Omnitrophota bacterium]